jgi:hypothetical protein
MMKLEMNIKFESENLKRRDPKMGVDGRTILHVTQKYGLKVWTRSASRLRSATGCFEESYSFMYHESQ